VGNPLRSPDSGPLTALAVVTLPGAYAFLGAALTRWIGFSPFVLGVTWAAVEIALGPLGLSLGLAAANVPGSGVLAWIGHVLGYALVAVVVGYVNAMLVAVLGHVRIAVPRFSRVTASSNRGEPLPPRTLMSRSRFALQPSRPRAPPLRVGRGADPTRQVCSPLGMRGSWRFMDIPMEIDDETASTLGLGHLGVFRCAGWRSVRASRTPFGGAIVVEQL
ncbi:MAG: hypothetical protein AABZ12_07325, partial [Planctomycetota bacterium]